jgi:hypothetical protein
MMSSHSPVGSVLRRPASTSREHRGPTYLDESQEPVVCTPSVLQHVKYIKAGVCNHVAHFRTPRRLE